MLCMLLCKACFCQEITVSACSNNPKDPAATINARFDLNNEICALIVIHPHNLEGLQVKGNIVDNIVRESAILIYVPNKTKRISVYHNNYIPLTLEFNELFGLSNGVVGGMTYNIYLNGLSEQVATPKKRSKESNYVCFEADVPLTKIVFDGQVWQVNGQKKVTRMVSCGEYKYTAYASGFPNIEGTVDVKKSIEPTEVSLFFQK